MARLDAITPIRAAQYVRMSTDHQRYSLEHQRAVIAAYASERGFELVRSFEDAGVSGLRLKGRRGLTSLLTTALSGEADFGAVLIFDVSRWGRFQDVDESAHYEFLCRRAGLRVEYCAEPFDNDGSPTAALMKHIKRVMAAEYSRDFGARTRAAKFRMAAKGFWQSGTPGYGLRRVAVDAEGRQVQQLESGEHKVAQHYRTILTPGPAEEVAIIRRIFRLYVVTGMTKVGIARVLNTEGVQAPHGDLWSVHQIDQILAGERYAGINVFGKTVCPMSGRPRKRPREDWVICEGAFEPVVDRARFDQAQRVLRRHVLRMSDADMIAGLRELFLQHGRLSAELIKDCRTIPCPEVYRRRFGGLVEAYRLVGYAFTHRQAVAAQMNRKGMVCYVRRNEPGCLADDEIVERLRDLLHREGRITCTLIDVDPRLPSASKCWKLFGGLKALYEKVGYQPDPKQLRTLGPRATRARRTVNLDELGGLNLVD